MESLQFKISNS